MKHFFLFFTFSFISISSLFAQEGNQLPEVKYNQWEVGMDLIWLIKQEYSPTIIIRKNTLRPKRNEFGVRKNAYRFSFYVDLEREIDYDLDTLNFHGHNNLWFRKSTEAGLGFRLGYEWNKKVESVIIYYGSDIGSTYARDNYYYVAPSNSYDIKTTAYTIDLIPFIGLKYNITKNILASIESNLMLKYSIVDEQRQLFQNSYHEAVAQSTIIRFVPVRMIAISYLF